MAASGPTYRPGQPVTSLLRFSSPPEWVVPVRAGTELRGLLRVDGAGRYLAFEGLPGGQPGSLVLPARYEDRAIPITFIDVPQIVTSAVLLEPPGQEVLFLLKRGGISAELDAKVQQPARPAELIPLLSRTLDHMLGN